MDTPSNEALLTDQHREIDLGIAGLVDGSGSRDELIESLELLRRHIYVEEAILFPLLADDYSFAMPLAQMKHEHGDMWPLLEAALEGSASGAPLDDVLEACRALFGHLQVHNPKEEEAIYAAVDRFTQGTAHQSLESAFETTAIPAGWVCEKARG